ncbi:glycosyltransferase family 2 protein [Budvicia aquatica]|uniref:glycosyltransferase family 2 protein n=1 Tax=Budvicia aquatica TaxID=82979 RepID=UPI00208C2F24|nr:glycosyltransferase family A protein [Budvicia aquatica]GKX51175.1 glycosyl transferase [Budvicia aquatica]
MKKLISIIIPVYNVQKFIGACLDSILPQVRQCDVVEVIIVDDGSQDASITIANQKISEYGMDKRVRIISQRNQGLSAARNTGIKNSLGSYLAFLDSDDLVSSDYINVLIHVIHSNPNVEVIKFDFLFFKCERELINARNNRIEYISYLDSNAYYESEIKDNSWYAWRRIYMRSLFRENAFDVGKKYEDVLLIPLITLMSKRSIEIDNILVYYRSNPDGITKRSTLQCAKDILGSVNKQLSIMEESGIGPRVKKIYLINIIFTFVNTVAVSNSGMEKINFIQSNISDYYPYLSKKDIFSIWMYFLFSQFKCLLSSIKRMLK